ncbi:MAG: hypothetical protein ABIR30_09115 [Chitinophagaceae bacterium]
MPDFKKIETSVLLTMVAAHEAYYGRLLTGDETSACRITISQIQKEIASRKENSMKLVNSPAFLSIHSTPLS